MSEAQFKVGDRVRVKASNGILYIRAMTVDGNIFIGTKHSEQFIRTTADEIEFAPAPDAPTDAVTEIAVLEAERDTLRAEVERLRGALEPFAHDWREYQHYIDVMPEDADVAFGFIEYMKTFYEDELVEHSYEAAANALADDGGAR